MFQNFHEIFKYFKLKYFIVHLYFHPASFLLSICDLSSSLRSVRHRLRKMAESRRREREVSESSECEEKAHDTSLNVTECVSCMKHVSES